MHRLTVGGDAMLTGMLRLRAHVENGRVTVDPAEFPDGTEPQLGIAQADRGEARPAAEILARIFSPK